MKRNRHCRPAGLLLTALVMMSAFTPYIFAGTWQEQVLYSFQGGSDGIQPGGVIFDKQGNMYGNIYSTTQVGGTGQACYGGCGTVFELTPQ